MCCKETTRIIEGSLPFYLSRQRLKRAIFLAVCADGNNQLGPELLAFSQRMNRDITSSASSPPSIEINSMWACWVISQSVRSCALCKYLMIGWSASTNNIVQVATPGGLTPQCWPVQRLPIPLQLYGKNLQHQDTKNFLDKERSMT
jgi:hypothetical protein